MMGIPAEGVGRRGPRRSGRWRVRDEKWRAQQELNLPKKGDLKCLVKYLTRCLTPNFCDHAPRRVRLTSGRAGNCSNQVEIDRRSQKSRAPRSVTSKPCDCKSERHRSRKPSECHSSTTCFARSKVLGAPSRTCSSKPSTSILMASAQRLCCSQYSSSETTETEISVSPSVVKVWGDAAAMLEPSA